MRLTPNEQRIMDALTGSPGGLTAVELTDILYGDDVDGGPLSRTISVFICRMRNKGIKIRGNGHNYRYRLVGADDVKIDAIDLLSPKEATMYRTVKQRPGIGISGIKETMGLASDGHVGVMAIRMRAKLRTLGEVLVSRPWHGYRIEKA